MYYAKRTVKCSAKGISRDEALDSLKRSKTYTAGTEILELTRQGEKWVATLFEPKTAEFPPSKDDADEEAPEPKENESPFEDSGDSKDSESDGPPKSDEGAGPKEPKSSEKAEIAALTDLVMAIADKLGVMPGAGVPGAEDSPMPDGPLPPPPGPNGAPSPHGGVGGEGHQEIVHRTKLKPGDTPPGVTPIGSPAFASLSRMASFDAFDDSPNKSIKEAKAELEALYGPHGFKVRQIKRVEGGQRLAAKLSRR